MAAVEKKHKANLQLVVLLQQDTAKQRFAHQNIWAVLIHLLLAFREYIEEISEHSVQYSIKDNMNELNQKTWNPDKTSTYHQHQKPSISVPKHRRFQSMRPWMKWSSWGAPVPNSPTRNLIRIAARSDVFGCVWSDWQDILSTVWSVWIQELGLALMTNDDTKIA